MLKNRVYGFSCHPGCRAQDEHECLKFAFPKKRGLISRLHHRVSHSVKNYRISHLAKLCLPGGLFVWDVFDCLGKTSFRVFVKCRRTRIDWLKRVSDYLKNNWNYSIQKPQLFCRVFKIIFSLNSLSIINLPITQYYFTQILQNHGNRFDVPFV